MVDKKKLYIGMIKDKLLGALIYDIVIIQTKGLNAQVNFNYTKNEILAILFENNFAQL